MVSTRAQDWREMLLTISTGLNKVGNFIRFSSVPASMVKIKEGWIEGQGGWRGFVSRCNFKLADWPRVWMDLSMHRGGVGKRGKSTREKNPRWLLPRFVPRVCTRQRLDWPPKDFFPGLARGACGHSRNSSTPRRMRLPLKASRKFPSSPNPRFVQ